LGQPHGRDGGSESGTDDGEVKAIRHVSLNTTSSPKLWRGRQKRSGGIIDQI
jgi:hypothetical protein